jgi:outer membrane protease
LEDKNVKNIAISFILILLSTVLFADDQLVFSFSGAIGRMFGQTSYELEVPDPVQGVMSLLEFPLGSTIVNLNLDLEKKTNNTTHWAIHTSFKTNIDDPGNKMKDSDWFLFSGYPPAYFSYTESDSGMRFLQADIGVEIKLFSGRLFDLYATGGYRYQYVDYDILGYDGWQYADLSPVDGQPELYVTSAPSTLKVLEYHISHHAPTIGFAFSIDTPYLTLDMAAGYQLVLISDYDDHLLRTKLSTAEGPGHGILCSLEGNYTLGPKIGSFKPYIFFAADYSYTYADIDQKQEWYGSADSVPAGTVYTGISHIIESSLFTSMLGIGLSY